MVKIVCINNNFIETEAYRITEEIRKNSLYKVVELEVAGANNLSLQKLDEQWNNNDLITKIILEDKNRNRFSVNPDHFGLRFAKGEISYNEYNQLQKKDNLKWFSYSILGIGFLMIMLYIILKFLY